MNWIMGRLGPLKTGSQGLEKCFGKRAPACLDAAWVYVCYTSPLVEFFGKKWKHLGGSGQIVVKIFQETSDRDQDKVHWRISNSDQNPRMFCAVPIIIVRRMRCTYFCAQQKKGRRSLWQRSPGCPGDFVALKSLNGHRQFFQWTSFLSHGSHLNWRKLHAHADTFSSGNPLVQLFYVGGAQWCRSYFFYLFCSGSDSSKENMIEYVYLYIHSIYNNIYII